MSFFDQVDEIKVLRLTLHGRLVDYLTGYMGGRNVLSLRTICAAIPGTLPSA